ncbi:MAG: branched-chain amino acid ABC transporter permease [Anaerolineales bacterium]|nr:branched-chain amino acid ABC transporter permease [Anaerolineales bacterium]
MQGRPTLPSDFSKTWLSLKSRLDLLGLSPAFLACVAVLALAPLLVKDAYLQRLLVISLFFGTLAMAFDFTGGFINAVNFGFAGFIGLGAYATALVALNTGLGPWIGLLIAAIASGSVGFLTGILTLPLRGIYVSLMSWFVGMTLMALAGAMEDVTHGARGLIVPPLFESITTLGYLYILLVVAVALYILLRLIIRSRIGLAFRAIGQNFDAACASGVNPTRYKLLNFTLSCACAGLLGGFYGHFVGIVTPEIMDTSYTMEVMALSFIGGSGSLLGGVFAAFLLIPIFDSLKKLMEYRLIIYGLLLIVVMIFYPSGLSGLYQVVVQYFKHWKGKREK